MLPANIRATQLAALQGWKAVAHSKARLRRLGRRCHLVRLRTLTHAWAPWAVRHTAKRASQRRADKFRRTGLMRKAVHVLLLNADASAAAARELVQRVARLRIRLVFEGWQRCMHLSLKVESILQRGRALRALTAWRRHTLAAAALKGRVASLQARWAQQRKQAWVWGWQQVVARKVQLREAEEQLREVTRTHSLARAFRHLSRAVRVEWFLRGLRGVCGGRVVVCGGGRL